MKDNFFWNTTISPRVKWVNYSPPSSQCFISHDVVIKWKHFPRYWPFVPGIHQSPVNSPQRPVTRSFDVFFDLCLDKRLSKKSWGWWFETPSRSLWRHCNGCLNRWWLIKQALKFYLPFMLWIVDKYKCGYIFILYFLHEDGVGNCNPSSLKTKIR